MKLTLGFSPCPNDTFIFDAIVNKRIDLKGIEFEIIMGDVEELNQRAFKSNLDITKLSYHAFAYLTQQYALLDAGSALGNNCGPLLISKRLLQSDQISKETSIAIPGKYTTANFLLGLAFPDAQNKTSVLFSDIEQVLLDRKFDAGLIIHENRFTYEQKGLKKIMDLGAFWEEKTGFPIPLGGIVVNRKLPKAIQQTVNEVLQESVRFAMNNPKVSLPYISQYAQEMDPEVMYQHIDLYVNQFTLDLGAVGKNAVRHLFKEAQRLQLIPSIEGEAFLNP